MPSAPTTGTLFTHDGLNTEPFGVPDDHVWDDLCDSLKKKGGRYSTLSRLNLCRPTIRAVDRRGDLTSTP